MAPRILGCLLLVVGVPPALGGLRCPSPRRGTARTPGTAAWVNTSCRAEGNSLIGHQEIYVRRGDRAPVVVSQVQIGPVADTGALCRAFGNLRIGSVSVLAGYYTQLAVSPDGTRVVFEVNDAFSQLDPHPLTDDQRGLYLLNADGGGLTKLRRATNVPAYRSYNIPGLGQGADWDDFRIAFSPDGRFIVYSDLGTASDGSIDAQLWSLRLDDPHREPTQLTRLSRTGGTESGSVLNVYQALFYFFAFADDDTIGFIVYDYTADTNQVKQRFYSVSVDGTHFRELSPIERPGGQVIPQFGVSGRRPVAQAWYVDGTPDNPIFDIQNPRELFIALGENVLQLTAFNRTESGVGRSVVAPNRRRVFFQASADPFGCNPTHNCQLFSIDVLGSRLRQLTRVGDGRESVVGCLAGPYPGCYVRLLAQDRATGTLVFTSPCDPLGTNPSGSQMFAVRPDGSGLRQITDARGVVTDTPDVIEVELPGPVAYQ